MNKRQENKLSMFAATKKVCDANTEPLSEIPALNATYTRFNDKLKELQNTLQIQGIQITGVTDQKDTLADQIIDKTVEIAGVVHAYASSTNNEKLKARTDFVRSDLDKKRDNLAIETYRQVLGDARGVSDQLTAYGITAEILADYEKKIEQYQQIVSAPREAIIERKTATEMIPDMINSIDEILSNELDRLMERFFTTNPVFYRDYFSARQIVDSGLRKAPKANLEIGEVQA